MARVVLTIESDNGVETYERSTSVPGLARLFGGRASGNPIEPLLKVVGLALGAHRADLEAYGAQVRRLMTVLSPILAAAVVPAAGAEPVDELEEVPTS